MHQCMPLVISIPPTSFLSLCPFFSLFSFLSFLYPFLLFLFPPLCVFVSSFFAFCFCFLLSAFSFALLRRLPFRCFLLVSFCFPGVLGGGVCLVWFVSLSYTPRVACEPAICVNLRILLCVLFLAFLHVSFSLSSLFDFDFDFDFDFSTSSCFSFSMCLFLWVLCGPLGFCGDSYSVPHVPDTYVRGPHFYFCLRCTMWFSYHVYYSLLYFYFFRGILPLQSYWSLSCDHGLHCIVAMS